MSDPNQIEVGDIVRVFMVYHQNDNPENFVGTILYSPCATGDCWHIREDDGVISTLHYVQTFAQMTLEAKASPTP